MALAIGIIGILVTVIPALIEIWKGHRDTRNALRKHSLDELHTGTDRVRPTPPV